MIEYDLNEKTIEMYMMRTYHNPQCISIDEYYDDIKKIKYIKRLLNRYENTGEIKERLLLNHIIVMYNIFGIEAASRILFYHLDKTLWPSLKTFLVYLNYMPEKIIGIDGKDIIESDIPINFEIAGKLRNI